MWKILYISHATFLFIGIITYYILLIFRLKIAFETSLYSVSKAVINSHFAILITICAVMIFGFFMFISGEYLIYILIMSSLAIIISICVLHITYLFNAKLFKMVLSQRQSIYDRQRSMTPSSKSKSSQSSIIMSKLSKTRSSLSLKQLSMINIITKHTLLQSLSLFIMILSTLISGLSMIWINNEMWIFVFYLWSIAITLIFVSFCVYLSFGVNQKCYHLFCHNCHNLMEQCCINLAEKKLIERSFQTPQLVPNTPSKTATNTSNDPPMTPISPMSLSAIPQCEPSQTCMV